MVCRYCEYTFSSGLFLAGAVGCILCQLRHASETPAHREGPLPDPIAKMWTEALQELQAQGVQVCRFCGCTERTPCTDDEWAGTCYWVQADVCSACADLDGIAALVRDAFVRRMIVTATIPKDFTPAEHALAEQRYREAIR